MRLDDDALALKLNITPEDLRKMTLPEIRQITEKSDFFKETFDELPVDINTFLDGPDYLGKYFNGKSLGDKNYYWRKALEEIYPSPHGSSCWLTCLKGVMGGKITTACAGMAYDLYRLLC